MVRPHGYFGSGLGPQVRWVQTTGSRPFGAEGTSKLNVADWVSEMFALLSFWTRMPPDDATFFGQPSSSIQRAVSSMWMHMSPIMPLEYSMKARQPRGWTSS